MHVQYLVALCCIRATPGAVNVIVGDMVHDDAAEKTRDVDVTVTVAEPDGVLRAFMAYEVKREGQTLDVATVEQLSAKLRDMPSLTHRAIVSTSGFSAPAIKKASAYGIELYTMKPWVRPLADQFPPFPGIGRPEDFLKGQSALLYWVNYSIQLIAPTADSAFGYATGETVYTKTGKPHPAYRTCGKLQSDLLLRSTEVLLSLEPAKTVLQAFPFLPMPSDPEVVASPAWPHTHTIDVSQDKVFLKLKDSLVQLDRVNISGNLQWRRKTVVPDFLILENVSDSTVFAGAAVTEVGSADGAMWAMILGTDSRAISVHHFCLEPKHQKMISKLRVPLPSAQSNDA
ncbi:MAG: hypothetical protein MUF00_12725 [Gemmatimonadaceae bacterium]|jgi:hypothetical protein|nr:hypothetical protein [Gemmatimonadaceae bacterium]